MEFSNLHIENLLSHDSSIITINKFPNNDEDHFFSLSENGDLKEWLITPNSKSKLNKSNSNSNSNNKIIQLEQNNLQRPSIEFLQTLNHQPSKSLTKNFSISCFLFYDNLLTLGYEDGLILTWRQERRNVIRKNRVKNLLLNKSFDDDFNFNNELITDLNKKNNENNNENKNNKNENNVNKKNFFKGENYNYYLDYNNFKNTFDEIKDKNRKMLIDDYVFFSCVDDENFIKSEMINDFEQLKTNKVDGENDPKFLLKEYYNIIWLKFILIGHSQLITNLFHYNLNQKNFLISSSIDNSIKIFDMNNGNNLYDFKLNDFVKFICICSENSTKKTKGKNFVTFLLNTPNKICIDLETEPVKINNFSFKYNDFNKVFYYEKEKKFFLLTKQGEIIIFNNEFKEINKLNFYKVISLYEIIPYKNLFLIFTEKFQMFLCEFNYESKKIIEKFYIKFGRNKISDLKYFNNLLYMTNLDGDLYRINIDYEYELFNERCNMKIAENFSNEFNVFYETYKSKKKKKKGNRGQSAKQKNKLPKIKKKK